ncbi:unnamed protein product [Penicillium palitans]
MRKSPAGVSWLAGVLALGWLACLLFGPAAIARTDAREAQSFDIPELPLKDALARFDTLTRRRSHAVSGIRAPHEALDEMLSGTGVTAERTAEDAFVLAPVNSPVSQDSSRGEANVAGSYLATLQNVVLRALCAQPSLSPGDYRLAMTVQVGANARVSRVRLLDTTGDARRDTTIVQRLQGLDVGRAPSDTTRPFVILLLPTGCRTGHVACVQSPCQAMTEH